MKILSSLIGTTPKLVVVYFITGKSALLRRLMASIHINSRYVKHLSLHMVPDLVLRSQVALGESTLSLVIWSSQIGGLLTSGCGTKIACFHGYSSPVRLEIAVRKNTQKKSVKSTFQGPVPQMTWSLHLLFISIYCMDIIDIMNAHFFMAGIVIPMESL